MNKRNKVVIFSLIATLATGLAAGSVFAAWGVTDNATSFGVQIRIKESSSEVTLYTNYDAGEWINPVTIEVNAGETISSAMDLSLDNYTFLGWKTSIPTADNHAPEYSTSELNALTVNSDLSLYPIFQSASKKAYVDSNYYDINTDIVLETNSIGSTYIGYTYVGIDGIQDVSASWIDTRNLYSASGIYQFSEDNGAALIKRRIGFMPNSNWAANWDGTGSGFGIHLWASNTDFSDIHLGVSSGQALYAYVPANYDNFMFSRYSSTATAFTWSDNKSTEFSFSGSTWSNNTNYSKDSTLLSMNSWSSWVENWGSSLATWNRANPNEVTEVPDNDFHNLNQYQFLQDNHVENYKTYANGSDLSAPVAMKLRFDDLPSSGTYYVQVAESIDELDGSTVYQTTSTYYELWNAKLSTTYYYRVATSEDGLASAEIRTITSTDLAPRVVNVPNVLNFRDIGGWDTYLVPGQKIKQGLYFRCAQLNQSGYSSTRSELDSQGKGKAAIKELGIKVDIDLRDSSNVPSQSPANTTEWPVSLVKASIPSGSESVRWEGGTYQSTNIGNQYVTVFNAVANCDTAPAMLHCTYGADRTGIATFFLESLLGMSIEDMTRDYVWTQFTQGRTVKLTESGAEFPQWISKTEALTGDTFADKMKTHLMSFGISEHTLEHIREIFIDGYVAQA